jgi:hypothetical protein
MIRIKKKKIIKLSLASAKSPQQTGFAKHPMPPSHKGVAQGARDGGARSSGSLLWRGPLAFLVQRLGQEARSPLRRSGAMAIGLPKEGTSRANPPEAVR